MNETTRNTLALIATLTAGLAFASPALAQATSPVGPDGLPAWVAQVGARREPASRRVLSANAFGAVGDGVTKSTRAIQAAIDAVAAAGGGVVTFEPGQYVTGALFLESNVHLRIDEGVTLLGGQDDADYPSLWTRVAAIEMHWPAALININEQANVKISAGGTIDGRGDRASGRGVRCVGSGSRGPTVAPPLSRSPRPLQR